MGPPFNPFYFVKYFICYEPTAAMVAAIDAAAAAADTQSPSI